MQALFLYNQKKALLFMAGHGVELQRVIPNVIQTTMYLHPFKIPLTATDKGDQRIHCQIGLQRLFPYL